MENASICLVQLVETTINRRLFKNNKCFVKIRKIKNHPILSKKLKFKFTDFQKSLKKTVDYYLENNKRNTKFFKYKN